MPVVLQLETIATDLTAAGGVGSASSVHLLNLEVQPAAAEGGEEAEAAAKVRRKLLPHLLALAPELACLCWDHYQHLPDTELGV